MDFLRVHAFYQLYAMSIQITYHLKNNGDIAFLTRVAALKICFIKFTIIKAY